MDKVNISLLESYNLPLNCNNELLQIPNKMFSFANVYTYFDQVQFQPIE